MTRQQVGGIDGNADAGTALTLDISLPGIDASGVMVDPATGGADIETQESLRARMLLAYQTPPQGGSDKDYEQWARAVPGITRCWTKRRLMGAGTVGVYIMCDGNDETNHGFPVGTDGLSQRDEWGVQKATGDQGRVADYIYPRAPVTAWFTSVRPSRRRWILRLVASLMLAAILRRLLPQP
nr:hypothetical protein SYMBAF_200012 [Serratia symbiotica]